MKKRSRGATKRVVDGKTLSRLGELADALPGSGGEYGQDQKQEQEHGHGHVEGQGGRGRGKSEHDMAVKGTRKNVRMVPPVQSLRSKPGAQKKRAKVEKNERERFGLNLAVLASLNKGQHEDGVQTEKTQEDQIMASEQPSVSKWQALRKHIAGSLEVVHG